MKLTLQSIREWKGYKREEISEQYNIPISKLKEFEKNTGKMPASLVIEWRKLYGIPIDYII